MGDGGATRRMLLEILGSGTDRELTGQDPRGPVGVLAGMLGGALETVFAEDPDGRWVSSVLSGLLAEHPDIEARLPVRTAQAVARVFLGDEALARLVGVEIRVDHLGLLLLLLGRHLGISREGLLDAVDEAEAVLPEAWRAENEETGH